MSNEDILKLMNDFDYKLMDLRTIIRQKDNNGIGYFNGKNKYENGFESELLHDTRDLSILIGKSEIDIDSLGFENIEQYHNEIMKLHELIWVEALTEFKTKLSADGIVLNKHLSREDCFEILDKVDLRLMEIKITKSEIDENHSSIYKHGQDKKTVPVPTLKSKIKYLISEESEDISKKLSLESEKDLPKEELDNDEQSLY